jgi:hypothetical protein
MIGTYFDGELIASVIFVWEHALMGNGRNAVMEDALAGIEHPG